MVIADDECLIRKRLIETIDWKELGITVCGAASNGIEALELVKKESPHLLLTDIRMPGLSGLELIEKMVDVNKGMKTIILTGFSEFAYAQQAIKLGVHDFLVKPIDEKELMKSIKKITTEIQKQNEEKMRLQILSVLKGDKEYMDESFQDDSHYFIQYRLLTFESEDLIDSTFLDDLQYQNIMLENKHGIGILYNLDNEELNKVKKIFEEYKMFGGCSQLSSNPQELQVLYTQANIARDQSRIEGKPGCLFFEQIDNPIQMKEMLDVIHSHYHEQITLHDLANRFYISDSYLSRIFKQYTGKNFIDYLTDLRISKAKELLHHSTLKTNEISKSVGYADQRYFSQIFKKFTGHTPSEFKAIGKKSEHRIEGDLHR
ncbi:response regulator [Bacillus sp. JJ1521]|uniref:response regulator transcription factor n=1 Tax=Bacillus sp. JJ1521 TaxID=3122957 RepID=UPI003000000B